MNNELQSAIDHERELIGRIASAIDPAERDRLLIDLESCRLYLANYENHTTETE